MKDLTELEKELIFYSVYTIQKNIFANDEGKVDCKVQDFINCFPRIQEYDMTTIYDEMNKIMNGL